MTTLSTLCAVPTGDESQPRVVTWLCYIYSTRVHVEYDMCCIFMYCIHKSLLEATVWSIRE